MRKLISVTVLVITIAVSAAAAPNDSSERTIREGAFARIIRIVKHIIAHPLDDIGVPTPPVPLTTT